MNRQGPGKIEWTNWSWNPITGCLHRCDYCYLEDLKRFNPDIFTPFFHPRRLNEPKNKKKPALIFTGSAADMWGHWVPLEWIDKVLQVCTSPDAARHTFQFLTKNPGGYGVLKEFPKNCWYGTTWDGTHKTRDNIEILLDTVPKDRLRFVSFEPLLNNPSVISMPLRFNWAVVGADKRRGADPPPVKWANWLLSAAEFEGIPIFIKDNYKYIERTARSEEQNGKLQQLPEGCPGKGEK